MRIAGYEIVYKGFLLLLSGIPIYLWMKYSSARAVGRVDATGTAEAIVARSDASVPEDMDAAIAKMIAVEQRELTG